VSGFRILQHLVINDHVKSTERVTFKQEGLPGFLFVCNNETEPKCLRSGLFGLPIAKLGEMYEVSELVCQSLLHDSAGCPSSCPLKRTRASPSFDAIVSSLGNLRFVFFGAFSDLPLHSALSLQFQFGDVAWHFYARRLTRARPRARRISHQYWRAFSSTNTLRSHECRHQSERARHELASCRAFDEGPSA